MLKRGEYMVLDVWIGENVFTQRWFGPLAMVAVLGALSVVNSRYSLTYAIASSVHSAKG